jgi:hypothetical protein
MVEIRTSYTSILDARRSKNLPMWYVENSTAYDLYVDISENILLRHLLLKEDSNITDFETYRKPYCDLVIKPDRMDIRTHDLCNTSSWLHGSLNSMYEVIPTLGKKLELRRFLGNLDKDMDFEEQQFVVALFEALYGNCPAFDSVNYSPTVYNDGEAGWVKVYPSNACQELEIWYKFVDQIPQCSATVFKYNSIDDIMLKGLWNTYGNWFHVDFPYREWDINKVFRYSKNERIETYLSGNQSVTSPNDLKGILSIQLDSYNDW